MRGYNRLLSLLPSIGVVALFLALLQVLLPIFKVPDYILPLPSSVVAEFFIPGFPWGVHIFSTLTEVLIGFGLAIVVGMGIAVAIEFSRTLKAIVQPIIVAAQVIPKVALVPVLFLWLGLNVLPRILTVFLVCFFPMVIDTSAGLAAAEPDMVDLVRSFNQNRLVILAKVKLPTALPNIFAGLKVASSLAVVGSVVSEFVWSNSGLGFLIVSSQVSLNTSLMFAAAALLIVEGFALYGLVALVENVIVPWRNADNA